MANSKLDLPGDFQPGKTGLLRHDLFAKWRTALLGDRIIAGRGIKESQTPQGRIMSVIPATADLCPFGQFIPIPNTDQWGIRGGIIYCGDQNWNIDPEPVDLLALGSWLYWIEVNCEVNRDDDGEIILPGIKTGTKPSGMDRGASYPANTAPEVSTGHGKIHIPLGRLTVMNGGVTFEPTDCGNITIDQCAGTLSHTRGTASSSSSYPPYW